ncbi:histone-lysine N-methyltransferase [Striga asiatica]|uniref:Histone-lysine N-methyltransferase n=1 Tax=Striga asiatica TaxID=4170 RepID=A0A5A7QF24_STRAF|nr:histone-lysine N-methyltransferase [Striga asiatica]
MALNFMNLNISQDYYRIVDIVESKMWGKQMDYVVQNEPIDPKKGSSKFPPINDLPRRLKCSKEMCNSSIELSSKDKNRVDETLNLFRDVYRELLHKHKRDPKREGQVARRFDIHAANILRKKGKWINSVSRFGHIPGVAIGHKFHFRVELAIVGLHCQYISGIDYTMLNGKKVATSIVNSGRYENKAKTSDILIYSGQGGLMNGGMKVDQELKRGNVALVNSMDEKRPVRVIRKMMRGSSDFGYTYDGLYMVKKFWQEKERVVGKYVFKFELHRMAGQEQLPLERTKPRGKECCMLMDVSHGMENFQIRAMNGRDCEKPDKFAYITNNIYPDGYIKVKQDGCDCTNGCLNSRHCGCILKNGGEIPYSEKGFLLRRKGMVHECGPSCKCPPSCVNRVSQHGPRYQLELYRTESRRWSVRSRSFISMGSFVCEFIGKVKGEDAIRSMNLDLQRFLSTIILPSKNDNSYTSAKIPLTPNENVVRFAIDASKVGNVGRFIRKSSTPNLVAQCVVYDHDDLRMPHVMFFATRNIPPLHELTCDSVLGID